MLSTKFVATVNDFNGSTENPSTPDKNGKMPIILSVVAGKAPNRTVLSGTVAERNGFEVGKSYLVQAQEIEPNEHGRQFRFNKISEMGALEILEADKILGEAKIIDVSTDADVDTDTGEVKESASEPQKYEG